MIRSKIQVSTIYYLLLFLLLFIYGFNKISSLGNGIKLFYLLLPFLYSFYFFNRRFKIKTEIKILITLLFFQTISIVNTLVFYPSAVDSVAFSTLREYIIFLLLIPLSSFYIKKEKYFNMLLLLIAIEVAISNVLYYFFYYHFEGRFQGTFGGANEFAYMMVFLIYVIYYNLHKYNFKFYINILLVVVLFLLHILVVITLSRTAILGLLIFYFISIPYFNKKLKMRYKLLLLIIFIVLSIYLYGAFERTFELLIERFTDSEGSSSLGSRFWEVLAGINVLKEHPFTLLFGNGTSFSGSPIFPKFYADLSGGLGTRIHNAYFALIVENGIVSFLIFVYFIFFLIKRIIRIKDKFKYVMLGFFIFTISFLGTIYLFYFLPFWLSLFLLSVQTHLIKGTSKI